MFIDFYIFFFFDKNLYVGMYIVVNFLRFDWEYLFLFRIDLYDFNFIDIFWIFYVLYICINGFKIDIFSTLNCWSLVFVN